MQMILLTVLMMIKPNDTFDNVDNNAIANEAIGLSNSMSHNIQERVHNDGETNAVPK